MISRVDTASSSNKISSNNNQGYSTGGRVPGKITSNGSLTCIRSRSETANLDNQPYAAQRQFWRKSGSPC
jgi:hypothetical protein